MKGRGPSVAPVIGDGIHRAQSLGLKTELFLQLRLQAVLLLAEGRHLVQYPADQFDDFTTALGIDVALGDGARADTQAIGDE